MDQIATLQALRALYDPARERSVMKELHSLDGHALRFIRLSPMLVLSSHGPGGADASPRGGQPGFVKSPDPHTLLIPDAPGNNRLDTLENIIHTGELGVLFLVPGMDETLRVNGEATLSTAAADLAACADPRREPKLVIRVTVRASYLHCAKALMRSELWNPARHIDRGQLPSMGEMLRDQLADRVAPETAWENQAQMLERYRQTL